MMTTRTEEQSLYEGANRIYLTCPECDGWDEHWEIVGGPVLNGRRHHLRTCQNWHQEPELFTRLDLDHAVASERAAVVAWLYGQAHGRHSLSDELRHVGNFTGAALATESGDEIVELARAIESGAHNGPTARDGEQS